MSTPLPPAHEPHDRDPAGQRQVLLWSVRLGFVVILMTVALLLIYRGGESSGSLLTERWAASLSVAMLFVVLTITADILTPNKKISTLVSIVFGLLGAMLVTAALGVVVDVLARTYEFQNTEIVAAVKLLMGLCLAYLGITTVLQTQDDFRLVIPYVEFAKEMRGTRPMILDTSALIDARITELARTRLVQSQLVIPRFVLLELQTLADSSDKLKRQRGRRGLDVAGRVQRSPGLDVAIDERTVPGAGVDQKLIELAKTLPGVIVTTDSALADVAVIQGAQVLNLHEVASAMRGAVLPGEPIRIHLVREGEQADQAVGYLEDGTMVVAERSRQRVGETVDLVVQSAIQTSAGRMVFAAPADGDTPEPAAAAEPNPERAPEQQNDEAEPAPEPSPERAQQPGAPKRTRPKPTGRNPRR